VKKYATLLVYTIPYNLFPIPLFLGEFLHCLGNDGQNIFVKIKVERIAKLEPTRVIKTSFRLLKFDIGERRLCKEIQDVLALFADLRLACDIFVIAERLKYFDGEAYFLLYFPYGTPLRILPFFNTPFGERPMAKMSCTSARYISLPCRAKTTAPPNRSTGISS